MKFLQRLPIEVYLVFMPIFVMTLTGVLIFSLGLATFEIAKIHIDETLLFGGHFLFWIINILYFYVIVACFVRLMHLFKARLRSEIDTKEILEKIKIFLRAFLLWVFVITFATTIYSFTLGYIFRSASRARIILSSDILMKIDHAIFGIYPPFWLQGIASNWQIGYLSVFAYQEIIAIITLVVISALFSNTMILRKFVLAFMISGVIGLPFWALVPAIAPQFRYVDNILNAPVPPEVATEINNVKIEKNVATYLPLEYKNWVDPKMESFPVSTFPSMHVAWGIIITVIGIEVFSPYAIILVPWLVFNTLGTMITLEHYAVDAIFGMLVAVLSLGLAKWALLFEAKYFEDKYNLMSIWQIPEKDGQKLLAKIEKYFHTR